MSVSIKSVLDPAIMSPDIGLGISGKMRQYGCIAIFDLILTVTIIVSNFIVRKIV